MKTRVKTAEAVERVVERVLERFQARTAKRPIWVDKAEIADLVTRKLVPAIVSWANRQPDQDKPIGNATGIAEAMFLVQTADGSASKRTLIRVRAKSSPKPTTPVSEAQSGTQGGNAVIEVRLNGAFSPAALTSPNRLQPLGSCSSESCLPHALYSILIHEATHVAEVLLGDPTYNVDSPADVYVNDPAEVRAFMQEIVDDAIRAARMDVIRTNATRHPTPNRRLVDLALKMSPAWGRIEESLTAANRKKILTAIHYALNERGLFVE